MNPIQKPGILLTISALVTLAIILSIPAQAEDEITFIHIGDTHYNTRSDNFEEKRDAFRRFIDQINAIPGTPYPEEVGGVAGKPMGVFIVGDLTEARPADFEKLVEDWGLKGGDGRLNFPLYEGAGNHDGGPSTRPNGHVRRAIIERNPERPNLASISENGLHYAIDYGNVHFIQLNEYAGLDDDQRYPGNPEYQRKGQSYGNPAEESLQFLKKTLAENVGDSGRPVILFQHYSIDGWSLHAWGNHLAWWTEEHVLRLWETIQGYNVIALMAGHDHSHRTSEWNGIPVYHMDSVRGFAVYRIKDDELVRIVRDVAKDEWGAVHRTSTSINSDRPKEILQGPYLVYNNDPTKMTVLWRTNKPVKTEFRWGNKNFEFEAGEVEVEPYDTNLNLYKITLENLEPNTFYTYQLQIGDQYDIGMFYSAPQPDADKMKFLVYGNTDAGPAEQNHLSKALYDHIYIDAAYHSILIHAGNWIPQIDNIEAWDSHFFSREHDRRHSRFIQSRMPIVGALGNSEGTPELFKKLFPYNFADETYHSFQYGPLHVTVMNPNTDYSEGSPQHTWLANDLAEATSPWKVLVYTGDQSWHDTATDGATTKKLLQPLCEEHGVDLVIDGSMTAPTITKSGTTHYIGLGSTPAEDPNAPHTLHFGAIHINGTTLTLEIIDANRNKVDTMEISK